MSLLGLMRTGVSGMAGQSNRLSTIADNVANSGTVGYKAAHTQFSSLLLSGEVGSYTSGGVVTQNRYEISRQGSLVQTSSEYDLAVQGEGFFVVNDAQGRTVLTRAGSFVPDGEGHLKNAGGQILLGYPLAEDGSAKDSPTTLSGLVPAVIGQQELEAFPTTRGLLNVTLPSMTTAVAAGDLPSTNSATAASTARTSLDVFGNRGDRYTMDVYFTRTSGTDEWEVAVYDASGRSASGGFPYVAGPVAQQTLTYDLLGSLSSTSSSNITIPVPNGQSMSLDLSQTKLLATNFSILGIEVNGSPPSAPSSIEITENGVVKATYENGSQRSLYRIALANVASPDRLTSLDGNSYAANEQSGDVHIGNPASGGFGKVVSGALESSTVDLAAELTDMIEAQRNYTANSKVVQTGAELLDVLVNLKR